MTIPNCQNMYFRFGLFVNDKIVPDDLDTDIFHIGSLPYFGMYRNQLHSLLKKPIELPAIRFGFISVNPVLQYVFSISVCSGRPDICLAIRLFLCRPDYR